MTNEFPLITTKQYDEAVEQWLMALNRGENCAVLFFPKADGHIRIGQFMADKQKVKRILGEKEKYYFLRITVDAHDTEDIQDLEYHIQNSLITEGLVNQRASLDKTMEELKQNNIVLVLVINEAERLLAKENNHILLSFSQLIDKYAPWLRFLSCFEADVTHPNVLPLLPVSGRLYENIYYFPLYKYEDSAAFMRLLKNQWGINFSQNEEKKIFHVCGGHFWLIKEAVRRIAANKIWSTESFGMQFRLRTIFNLLTESEQNVVKKIIVGQDNFNPDEDLSFKYLQRMNLIEANNIQINGFKDLILNEEAKKTEFTFKDEQFFLNDVPINKFFSRKELRVLKILMRKQNELVTRDELAKNLWSSSEDYSDWAIDQLIARVRKRLKDLAVSPSLLASIRGKGYIFKNNIQLYE